MRFRLGRVEDMDACHRFLLADDGFRASPEVLAAVPAIWRDVFPDPARGAFIVFETYDGDEIGLCGFAMSTFVHERWIAQLRARLRPYVVADVYARHLRGDSPVLSLDEIRAANTEGRLHLVSLHVCHRHPDLTHPETRQALPIALHAFHFSHSGYRLQSATVEVYGTDSAAFMAHGGWPLLSSFDDHEEARSARRRPYLFSLDRAQVHPAEADSMSLQMFHPQPPRLHFSSAEQRVLVYALTGLADRQLAAEIGVSVETVRSAWDSIYTRVGRAQPRLLASADDEAPTARGAEKRRQLLDYLRQHMEELRPIARP